MNPAARSNPVTEPSMVATFDPMAARGGVKTFSEDKQLDRFLPAFVETMEHLDVGAGFLSDLALKAVSLDADATTASVATRLRLGMVITEELLQRCYRERLLEMCGVIGLHNHRYKMLERGWLKVTRLMTQCSYTGAAPVSLQAYSDAIVQQVRQRPPVTQRALDEALAMLVLPDAVKQTLGLVASSGRSLFLTGPSGNGKTVMARALVDAIPGTLWIPYAIEVDGQIIRVYDSHNHQVVECEEEGYDRRWIQIRPPLVVVGGELTIQSLDLISTDTQRFYEAPFQVKSNGGVLVVDDLGRQRCTATELLNRWIIPLENRVDYLTLSTGKKIQVPFEQVVVFATNLTTSDLHDEAFLRRMGYRLPVQTPTPEVYAAIYQHYARSRNVPVDSAGLERVLERYRLEKRTPKCCDPRDLIERAIDLCTMEHRSVFLSPEAMDVAWNNYFGVPTPSPAVDNRPGRW